MNLGLDGERKAGEKENLAFCVGEAGAPPKLSNRYKAVVDGSFVSLLVGDDYEATL